MTYHSDTVSRPSQGLDLSALDRTDRILLGACAVVWLAALGAGVAATVALVDLAHGFDEGGDSGTPWFLYAVIGVSAAVIVAAVPLLLRARRAAQQDQEEPVEAKEDPQEPQPAARGPEAPTEKLRAVRPGQPAEASGPLPRLMRSSEPDTLTPVLDQVFLRFGAAMVCAMGVATFLTGVATYLMAVDTDALAWGLYALAGVVTVGMGGLVWYFLRELGTHRVGENEAGADEDE